MGLLSFVAGMRIVHIITRLIIGGAQENTLLSCEGQHARGHDVTLITGPAIGPEGSLLERAQRGGYRVIVVDEMRRAIRASLDWQTYQRLVNSIRELEPDVVHTHSSKAGILGRWAAKKAQAPVIIHTIHGLAFTASTSRIANFAYRVLERKAAPITTRIVCVADAMRDQSLAANIGQAGQYLTVYSGMETAPFLNPPIAREATRKELGIADDQVVVGTIARLFDLKGHDDLLDLAPELCKCHAGLRFLWVGDGTLRNAFEQRIAAMGLQDRFILTGLVPPEQIPELTGAMDILVHPSRREGLARAIVQGQLAGAPAIAYDIDGNREGLIDYQTGFIVPPFDRRMLGEKLSILIDDAEKRRTMGSAGRAFALSRFDANVMVEALERVYEQARSKAHP
jgi:glycosyltransferase involved in cell wall biosynthesis